MVAVGDTDLPALLSRRIMATKTLIPALRAHVGDWQYYVSVMTYATVSNQVNFAYELGNANQDLSSMIQRGLSSRTKDIVFDPFMGSGTTAAVAQRLNRQYLGCELNTEYKKLQDARLSQQSLELL